MIARFLSESFLIRSNDGLMQFIKELHPNDMPPIWENIQIDTVLPDGKSGNYVYFPSLDSGEGEDRPFIWFSALYTYERSAPKSKWFPAVMSYSPHGDIDSKYYSSDLRQLGNPCFGDKAKEKICSAFARNLIKRISRLSNVTHKKDILDFLDKVTKNRVRDWSTSRQADI